MNLAKGSFARKTVNKALRETSLLAGLPPGTLATLAPARSACWTRTFTPTMWSDPHANAESEDGVLAVYSCGG